VWRNKNDLMNLGLGSAILGNKGIGTF